MLLWAASFLLKWLGFFELSERGKMYPNSKELQLVYTFQYTQEDYRGKVTAGKGQESVC